MNEDDLTAFNKAYEDFMKHVETEDDSHFKWQEARQYTNSFYKQKAKKLNININYYLEEFV